MEQFEFKCPQCGQMVRADESLRGLVFPCPHCEKGIVVPKKAQERARIMAGFKFSCPQCGQEIEADEAYCGQVAECPYCGKGIVVPKVKENHRVNVRTENRTSGSAGNFSDPNFLAIQRRMAEQEKESQEAASRIGKIRQMNRRREIATKAVCGLVLLIVCALGFFLWKGWRDDRAAAAAMEQAAKDAQKRVEDERLAKAAAARKDESEKRKAEEAVRRKEREAKLKAQEAEREQRRAEDAKRRAEAERMRAENIAAERIAREQQDSNRKKLQSFSSSLSDMPISLWRNLPKDLRPESAKGEFKCLMLDTEGYGRLYEIECDGSGDMKVSSISQDGIVESMPSDTFKTSLAELGGLWVAGGKAYIVSPRLRESTWPVPQGYVFPAELMLRGVHRIISNSRVSTDGISFAVSYVSENGKTETPIRTVPFSAMISRSEILDAVVQNAMKSYRAPKAGARLKRRTVVMYDGLTVKRMADGVTYVPQVRPRGAGKSYDKLVDEARRQEIVENEAKSAMENASRNALERYRQQIEESLDGGRIKISILAR